MGMAVKGFTRRGPIAPVGTSLVVLTWCLLEVLDEARSRMFALAGAGSGSG